jgi:hypothetical protein
MTWLQGRTVRFQLTAFGKEALAGAIKGDSVSGIIEVVDDLGAWIVVGSSVAGRPYPLLLLKWETFSTAVVEVEPAEEAPKSRIGF